MRSFARMRLTRPLEIVQAIDAEQELGALQAFAQAHDFRAADRLDGAMCAEILNVDADRKRRQLSETPFRRDGAVDNIEAKLGLQNESSKFRRRSSTVWKPIRS